MDRRYSLAYWRLRGEIDLTVKTPCREGFQEFRVDAGECSDFEKFRSIDRPRGRVIEEVVFLLARNPRGRLAQRQSIGLTHRGSQVQILHRPPVFPTTYKRLASAVGSI